MADQKKKEMADFKDFTWTGGPVYWEDLDKDFLIKVLLQWSSAVRDLTWGENSYHAEIAKRWGWDTAIEISKTVAENYLAKYLPKYCEIAKIKPQSIVEAMRAVFLSPDGTTMSRNAKKEDLRDQVIGSKIEIVNPNHIIGTVEWCIYADHLIREVEAMGVGPEQADEMLKDMCTMDAHLGGCYFEKLLPGKKVECVLEKWPSVKTKGQAPACIMHTKVVEE